MRAREADPRRCRRPRRASRRSAAKLVSTPGAGRGRRSSRSGRAASARARRRRRARSPRRPVRRQAAVLAAAHARHDAVGAVAVAARRDLQPGLVLAVALERQRPGEVVERREVAARDRAARLMYSPSRWMLPGPKAKSTNGYCSNSSSFIDSDQHPPTTITLPGSRCLAARASIRCATRRSSAFSRIVQVLKTSKSASAVSIASPRPDRLEQTLDPLGVVHVHLAAEGRDRVRPHRRNSSRPGDETGWRWPAAPAAAPPRR